LSSENDLAAKIVREAMQFASTAPQGTDAKRSRPVGHSDPLIGALVSDRFRVDSLLGAGGMGRVYLAFQVDLDRWVALKVMTPGHVVDPDTERRFLREARAGARLAHPGSVVIYDVGVWEGWLFIAMELLVGHTLLDVINRDFPLRMERVVDLMVQVCATLGAAHDAGIVHRDLKPENIMITTGTDGRELVKVVDFGLAILLDSPNAARITVDGAIAGTPAYMSPEQCRGAAVDARSDIYSLGAITYELLCGLVPFEAENSVGVLMKHVMEAPMEPSARRPDLAIPPGLEAAAMLALSKRPSDRPSSAGLFAALLQDALDGPGSRRKRPALGDRASRRADAGLDEPNATFLTDVLTEVGAVLVVEYGRSEVSEAVKLAGFLVDTFARLADAPLDINGIGALVVDVRNDPGAGMAAVRATLAAGSPVPFIVVGPDDAVDVMSQALQSGATDYVAGRDLNARLPKAIQRASRLAKRRKRV
jgi:hypothetical protein